MKILQRNLLEAENPCERRVPCLWGSSVQTATKCYIVTLSSKAEEAQTPRLGIPVPVQAPWRGGSQSVVCGPPGVSETLSGILKIKTVFIAILRYYLPFSLC